MLDSSATARGLAVEVMDDFDDLNRQTNRDKLYT